MNFPIPFILAAVAGLLSTTAWGQIPAQPYPVSEHSIQDQFHVHPQDLGHGHADEPRTEIRTIQKQVQVYNPQTGQYETQIVEEAIVVPIGGVVGPGGQAGNHTFVATIVNNRNELLTVNVNQQERKLNPGQSWQVRVSDGQAYSYYGEPRITGPGTRVGGAIASARFSSNQATYNIGGGVAPVPVPGVVFLATFVNNGQELMTVSTDNQTQQLNPGQTWQVRVSDGETYSYHGPGRSWQNPDGSWAGVGGALAQGRFSINEKVINLGGGGGGGGQVPIPKAQFQVTFVNRYQVPMTVQAGSEQQKLLPGHSWIVTATEGQRYAFFGEPQQINGRWVSGVTYPGEFTASEKVVNLGPGAGNPGGGTVPGVNPATNGSFQVTFTNYASGPVNLTLYDTQRNVVEVRTLQVNQSFSANAKFGYSYHQDGPNVNTAFGSSSASASGGISSANPNIILRTPQ